MKVGTLFKLNNHMGIHEHLEGTIGIILSKANRYGQYKTQVADKILYLMPYHMEQL